MSKQIIFNYEGRDYTLEFTRKSVETLERSGFIAADIAEKPMLTLPALFAGAFIAHHRTVKKETIDEIFDKLSNKQDLIAKLAEMYNDPIISLIDEPEENDALGWDTAGFGGR
jgi:hypothetical protein